MNDIFRTFMGTGSRPWLRNDGRERLFTLKLQGVDTPLDPDPYWDSTYAGGSLFEATSKSSSKRLKEALDAHRALHFVKGEFDFQVEEMLVFSDVVMWLPAKIWKNSVKEGGKQLFGLSDKLKYLHKLDFGEMLYNGRKPNYSIMPLKSLKQDEVIFQFGLGVFLPNDDDVQTAEVKLLRKGKKSEVFPKWVFFENQQEIERPSSLYSKQHFLLVGNTLDESAIQSPSWFSEDKGYLMVDTYKQPNRIYGDDEYIIEGKIKKNDDITICPFYAGKGESKEEISLMIERNPCPFDNEDVDSKNNTHPSRNLNNTRDTLSDDPLSGLTVLSGNEPPRFRYYIAITGIVLPRRSYANIKYWVLHLDQEGMPAKKDEISKWILRGNQKTLEWRDVQGQQWQTLDTEKSLPFLEKQPLSCRSLVLGDAQHAILMLPQILAFPLSKQAVTLGRGDDNNISLQLLNREDSIEWLRPTRHQHTMGHLGLSAKHLSLSIEGQSMLLQQLSTNAATHILQNELVSHTLKAGMSSEIKLKPGQEVIVGNYLLQYQREYIFDNKI